MKESIIVRILGVVLLVLGAVGFAGGVATGPALLALLGLFLWAFGVLCLVFGNL